MKQTITPAKVHPVGTDRMTDSLAMFPVVGTLKCHLHKGIRVQLVLTDKRLAKLLEKSIEDCNIIGLHTKNKTSTLLACTKRQDAALHANAKMSLLLHSQEHTAHILLEYLLSIVDIMECLVIKVENYFTGQRLWSDHWRPLLQW